jgi:hypothetical protein
LKSEALHEEGLEDLVVYTDQLYVETCGGVPLKVWSLGRAVNRKVFLEELRVPLVVVGEGSYHVGSPDNQVHQGC